LGSAFKKKSRKSKKIFEYHSASCSSSLETPSNTKKVAPPFIFHLSHQNTFCSKNPIAEVFAEAFISMLHPKIVLEGKDEIYYCGTKMKDQSYRKGSAVWTPQVFTPWQLTKLLFTLR
jgi:hypothetical protein